MPEARGDTKPYHLGWRANGDSFDVALAANRMLAAGGRAWRLRAVEGQADAGDYLIELKSHQHAAIAQLVASAAANFEQPMVLDADALVGQASGLSGRTRILTPHPGEMARLTGKTTAEIQADRLTAARDYATAHGVTVVLKGQRTLLAFPDGRVWINPTGTPAMGTGGTGDILTGLIAGFLAQFPRQPDQAVAAAVYLHGLAGQLGARAAHGVAEAQTASALPLHLLLPHLVHGLRGELLRVSMERDAR